MSFNEQAWKVGFKWTKGDASNPAGSIAVDTTSKALHIADIADISTDWNVSADSHPSLYIHSATTPATDYIELYHNATSGFLNVASGTFAVQIDGTTAFTVSSVGPSFPAGTDLTFTGTTGTNDIVLTNALADALSITDGSADILVFDTSTTGNVLTLTGSLLATNASLNATTGRVGKFSGTVAAGNFGDGYGAVEVDVTSGGAQAGHVAAFSAWLNLGADYSNASTNNFVQAMNVGVYCPAGRTLTNSKIIMGARMSCVIDDGANPSSIYLFSTNIYSNTLTALFDVNAIGDMGGSTGAQTGNDYKIPLFYDSTAGQAWYVNIYHS